MTTKAVAITSFSLDLISGMAGDVAARDDHVRGSGAYFRDKLNVTIMLVEVGIAYYFSFIPQEVFFAFKFESAL